jgi:hypothetical protein
VFSSKCRGQQGSTLRLPPPNIRSDEAKRGTKGQFVSPALTRQD